MFKKLWEIIIVITAWTAILFQAYLTTGSFGNLFSYFTVLTNLLIAISITAILFLPQKSIGLFCKKLSIQTAIALCIFIVYLECNTVLRGILTLHGWNLFTDTLLHVVVPLQYIFIGLFLHKKGHHPTTKVSIGFIFLLLTSYFLQCGQHITDGIHIHF